MDLVGDMHGSGAGAASAGIRHPARARSFVVVLTRDPAVEREAAALGWRRVAPDMRRRPWSDDYANALEAMRDRLRPPAAEPPASLAAYGAGRTP